MLRLLLDTHVLLWALAGHSRLSTDTLTTIADPLNEVFVNAGTLWEIAIKRALGKLHTPENLIAEIALAGLIELPVTFRHGQLAAEIPLYHKNPFDRMLVAQAQAEGLILVTDDATLQRYGVPTLSA